MNISACGNCGKNLMEQVVAQSDVSSNKSLNSLDVCVKDSHAEHIRFTDVDDACDDGRFGLRE